MYFLTKERKARQKKEKALNYLISPKIWSSYRYFCQF